MPAQSRIRSKIWLIRRFGEFKIEFDDDKGTATLLDHTTNKEILKINSQERNDIEQALRSTHQYKKAEKRFKKLGIEVYDIDLVPAPDHDESEPDRTPPKSKRRKHS